MITPPLISLNQTIRSLRDGHVGVLPTDTVYGLAASAHNRAAVERLYRLKNREQKPGTLIAASIGQLQELGVPDELLDRLKPYWPGPLSAVLPISDSFSYLHQGVGDIAMRIVADEAICHLLEQTGPLMTSSANHPGAPGATTVNEAWDYFHDLVDFYVDGGDLSNRPPSSIVKFRPDGSMKLLRQGAVSLIESK